ncbi:hypothetical protein RUND412_004766 [Rhizina undulata]
MTKLTSSPNFLYTVTLLLLLFLLIVVVYPAVFLEIEEEPAWIIWTLLSVAIACSVEYYMIPLAIRRLGEDLEFKMREWRMKITGVIEELERKGLHNSDAKREKTAEEIRAQENEEVVTVEEELLDTQFPLLDEANYKSTHENKAEALIELKTEFANSAIKIPHFSEERLTSPPTPAATPERGKERLKKLLADRRKKDHWDLPESEMKSAIFEYEEPPVILNWRDPAEAHRMIDWAEKMLAGIRESWSATRELI